MKDWVHSYSFWPGFQMPAFDSAWLAVVPEAKKKAKKLLLKGLLEGKSNIQKCVKGKQSSLESVLKNFHRNKWKMNFHSLINFLHACAHDVIKLLLYDLSKYHPMLCFFLIFVFCVLIFIYLFESAEFRFVRFANLLCGEKKKLIPKH